MARLFHSGFEESSDVPKDTEWTNTDATGGTGFDPHYAVIDPVAVLEMRKLAEALCVAVEALMNAMADERPLREPETAEAVLIAWDAVDPALEALRAALGA